MAWNLVQSAGTAQSGSPVTTYGCTYTTANLTAGSKLIAVVGTVLMGSSAAVTTGVTDGTNPMTLLASLSVTDTGATPFTANCTVWAMDCPAGDAGTKPTLTATFPSSFGTILIQEVTGLLAGNTTAMRDGPWSTNTASGAVTSITPGAYSSTAASEYMLDIFFETGQSVTWTKPAAYTTDPGSINSSGNQDIGLFYANSANGAEAAAGVVTFLTAPSTFVGGIILGAIKLAGGTNATVTMGSALSAATSAPVPQPGSLSGPSYAASAADLGGGTGSWSSTANADGAPDGSYATWAVV